MKKETNWKFILAIVAIVLAVIIIWGLIGGNVVEDNIRIKCDVGMGDSLCWKWHDAVEEFQGDLQDATDSFKNMFDK